MFYVMGIKYEELTFPEPIIPKNDMKMAFVSFLIFFNIVDSKSFLICKLYFLWISSPPKIIT